MSASKLHSSIMANGVSPARSEESVHTGPTVSGKQEIEELREEVARLKRQLEQQGKANMPAAPLGGSSGKIWYADAPFSGARLAGITKPMLKAGKIQETTSFPYLPKPTTDMTQLEEDFMKWGYCIVKDALSPDQVKAQKDRLMDQAEAEKMAKVAMMSHADRGQTIGNIIAKGEVFRDLITFEESACQGGSIIEEILQKSLGKGFYCTTAHGSIVHEGGGLQELHQDQGYVPLPHPPYALVVLMIYSLSDFGLENGGTYVIPGSHLDDQGNNRVRADVEFEKMAHGEPGLCVLKCPPGQCFIMDARVLHSGGRRTAPGTRYAHRILYSRGHMRHQENSFLGVPDDVILNSSPKLRDMMGFTTHHGLGMVNLDPVDPQVKRVPIPELSMSRPEEFDQDFDFKHSKMSEFLEKQGSKYNESKPSRWKHQKAKL